MNADNFREIPFLVGIANKIDLIFRDHQFVAEVSFIDVSEFYFTVVAVEFSNRFHNIVSQADVDKWMQGIKESYPKIIYEIYEIEEYDHIVKVFIKETKDENYRANKQNPTVNLAKPS